MDNCGKSIYKKITFTCHNTGHPLVFYKGQSCAYNWLCSPHTDLVCRKGLFWGHESPWVVFVLRWRLYGQRRRPSNQGMGSSNQGRGPYGQVRGSLCQHMGPSDKKGGIDDHLFLHKGPLVQNRALSLLRDGFYGQNPHLSLGMILLFDDNHSV